MRGILCVAALGFACGAPANLVLSPSTETLLVVREGDGPRRIDAIMGPQVTMNVALAPRTSILSFERSFAELELPVRDGVLPEAPTEGRALPRPSRWIEVSDGDWSEPPLEGFDARFAELRVMRAGCEAVAVPGREDRLSLDTDGVVSFTARLGARDLVVGTLGDAGIGATVTVVRAEGASALSLGSMPFVPKALGSTTAASSSASFATTQRRRSSASCVRARRSRRRASRWSSRPAPGSCLGTPPAWPDGSPAGASRWSR